MEEKRLFRNTKNAHIGGVASGLAEYFNTDVVLIRLLFVILTIFWGGGLMIYIICWIVIPQKSVILEGTINVPPVNSETPNQTSQPEAETAHKNRNGSLIGGLILIAVGLILIIKRFVTTLSLTYILPAIIIIIGLGIMLTAIGFHKKDKS